MRANVVQFDTLIDHSGGRISNHGSCPNEIYFVTISVLRMDLSVAYDLPDTGVCRAEPDSDVLAAGSAHVNRRGQIDNDAPS